MIQSWANGLRLVGADLQRMVMTEEWARLAHVSLLCFSLSRSWLNSPASNTLCHFIKYSIQLIHASCNTFLHPSPPHSYSLPRSFSPLFQSVFLFILLSCRCLTGLQCPSSSILPLLLHSLMKSAPRCKPHSTIVFHKTPTIYHFVRKTLKLPEL